MLSYICEISIKIRYSICKCIEPTKLLITLFSLYMLFLINDNKVRSNDLKWLILPELLMYSLIRSTV